MKYEKPIMEIMKFEVTDIVCTSPNIEVGGGLNNDNDDGWS